ncbi:MAG TPA: hypothetical protein VHT75_04795 [Acidimicrobiales bacterium]|jgi:hypothetical protein|nr:hypothetical protein [Acidimicrobiales bacterium]
MPSDAETETELLARIDGDLGELTSHVNTWLADRFLTPETAAGLNLEDVSGLILWLQQWRLHFEEYAAAATELAAAGRPAVVDRLAQIRVESDNSIAQFTAMAAGLLEESGEPPPPTSPEPRRERRR